MQKFNLSKYDKKYYKRHLDQYRDWENAVGETIVEILKPKSIIDLGCGVGSYLEGALRAGCKDILGIEIAFDVAKEFTVDDIAPFIQCGDITSPVNIPRTAGENRTFDCAMSIEVAEHIEPEGTDNFISNLTRLSSQYIVFTAAPPGQGGRGHINLREKNWWIEKIRDQQVFKNGSLTEVDKNQHWVYRPDLVNLFITKWKQIEISHRKENSRVPDYILRNLMVFSKSGITCLRSNNAKGEDCAAFI